MTGTSGKTVARFDLFLIALAAVSALTIALIVISTKASSNRHITQCKERGGIATVTEKQMYGSCQVGGVTVDRW